MLCLVLVDLCPLLDTCTNVNMICLDLGCKSLLVLYVWIILDFEWFEEGPMCETLNLVVRLYNIEVESRNGILHAMNNGLKVGWTERHHIFLSKFKSYLVTIVRNPYRTSLVAWMWLGNELDMEHLCMIL